MAIRITRVYTRTGDDGTTALVGGKRVAKTDRRIAAYGDVDELNCVVGVVRSMLVEPPYRRLRAAKQLDAELAFIQQELFDLGSELATPPEAAYDGMIRVGNESIERLEGVIDALQDDLEPLRSFVLPGGGTAGAMLHLARTVCRRTERSVLALVGTSATARKGKAGPSKNSDGPARYLNRLSDLLFVQARWIAVKTGKAETLWQHGLEPPSKRKDRSATRSTRSTNAKPRPSKRARR